jgi:hypothetical protein
MLDSVITSPSIEFDETIKKKRICEVCGSLHYYDIPYCSIECRREYNKKIRESDENILNKKYCNKFNSEFKIRVRAFFGNRCFLCGKDEKTNGKGLSIHHVNYDKSVLCNGAKTLFVPLCKECHARTNENRHQWENFFEYELREKYNSRCYFTKQELYSFGTVPINTVNSNNETLTSKDEEIKMLREENRILKMHKEKLLNGFYQNTAKF